MEILKERLNQIIPRITSEDFLKNKGLGNEIAFYIFDYPPVKELEVRDHIEFILHHLSKIRPDLQVKKINLFELIIEYLRERRLLDKALKIQKEKGNSYLLKALKAPLSADKIAKVFAKQADPCNHDLIMVSGVGNAWPLIRSRNLLNNLHPLMADTPLILFYPGVYTGYGLRLFGKLKESNYYRAFQLVPGPDYFKRQ